MNDLQIEYFLAVVDNLSFTKTASEKYVSQPAVSKQISAMEEELGVPLFERTHKSIRLTDAGMIFAEFYKKQRQDLSLITQQARKSVRPKNIPLRISCPGGWNMINFMPTIIRHLAASHPEIQLLPESGNICNLTTALVEDEADIVIGLSTSFHTSANLQVHKLTAVPHVIVYSEAHPLAGEKQLTPADFRNELFFIPANDEAVFIVNLVKSCCQPYGFIPRIQGVKNFESLILRVTNGLGVAVVDSWVMQTYHSQLRSINIDSCHSVSIGWRNNNTNPALPIFIHELAQYFYPDGNSGFDPRPC